MELLNIIHGWRKSKDLDSLVFWLNGLAGQGKSTVARTVAEAADKSGELGGSFCFSRREDRFLRTASRVIPTLVFQLALRNPSFCAAVLKLLDGMMWAELPLLAQARKLGLALQSYTAPFPPPLIVLDALDECESSEAVSLLSVLLGSSLQRTSGTRAPLKVLITSRPEAELTPIFEEYCPEEYRMHEMGGDVVDDIRRYLEGALYRVRKDLHLPNPDQRWFSDQHLDILVERAGSLFIYAATVVRFIRTNPPGPKSQLDTLITQKSSTASPYAVLDAVYLEIVKRFLSDSSSGPKTVARYYTEVVGSMLFLRDLLTIRAIAELMVLDTDDVITTIRPLHSIITQSSDIEASTSFYHASFYDFVTSDRCVEPVLRFSQEEREAYLAKCCLLSMTRNLRENMAAIQDPTTDAVLVPGLISRIPEEIAYATRFWGSHLRGATRIEDRAGLTEALSTFIGLPLLYWVEVCGVLGSVGLAVQCLKDVLQWMVRDSNPGENTLNIISAAECRFNRSRRRHDQRYVPTPSVSRGKHHRQPASIVYLNMANDSS